MLLKHYTNKVDWKYLPVQAQEQSSWHKPIGLWLSVPGPMDWEEFCITNSFRLDRLQYSYEMEIVDRSKVCFLSSFADMIDFSNEYGADFSSVYGGNLIGNTAYIKWKEVATIWGGIVISPYVSDFRNDRRLFWYQGWDCRSGCFWDYNVLRQCGGKD